MEGDRFCSFFGWFLFFGLFICALVCLLDCFIGVCVLPGNRAPGTVSTGLASNGSYPGLKHFGWSAPVAPVNSWRRPGPLSFKNNALPNRWIGVSIIWVCVCVYASSGSSCDGVTAANKSCHPTIWGQTPSSRLWAPADRFVSFDQHKILNVTLSGTGRTLADQ